jgi:hypothetical protein
VIMECLGSLAVTYGVHAAVGAVGEEALAELATLCRGCEGEHGVDGEDAHFAWAWSGVGWWVGGVIVWGAGIYGSSCSTGLGFQQDYRLRGTSALEGKGERCKRSRMTAAMPRYLFISSKLASFCRTIGAGILFRAWRCCGYWRSIGAPPRSPW